MAGLTPEPLTKIRKLADKAGITITNTIKGRNNLDMLRKRLGFRSGGSVSISDRDVAKTKEMINKFRDKEKTKAMKDGGMVGSSISNFKGTF